MKKTHATPVLTTNIPPSPLSPIKHEEWEKLQEFRRKTLSSSSLIANGHESLSCNFYQHFVSSIQLIKYKSFLLVGIGFFFITMVILLSDYYWANAANSVVPHKNRQTERPSSREKKIGNAIKKILTKSLGGRGAWTHAEYEYNFYRSYENHDRHCFLPNKFFFFFRLLLCILLC